MAAVHKTYGYQALQGLSAYRRLARFENALLPAVAVGVGFSFVRATNYRQLWLTILSLVLLHSILTIWNDIADEASDAHNNIMHLRAVRAAGVYRTLAALIGLSIIAVVVLSVYLPNATRLILVIGFGLGWAYNVPPIQASRRPWASIITLGLSYGTIPLLAGASLGHLDWPSSILAAGWTMSRGSLSILKDYKDAPGDASAGKRTFLLVFGGTKTARLSFGLAAIGLTLCIATISTWVHRPVIVAAALLVTAVWLLYVRTELFRAQHYATLNRIFHDCLRYQLVFDGLVIVCLRTL